MRPVGEEPKPVAKLERSLTLTEAVIYGVGLILGAGIYVLIGRAAGIAGNALWLSFIIAAALASLTALSYAELTSIFPKEAAEYIYAKKASGGRFISFFIGFVALLTILFSTPTVSLGFAEYFSRLFSTPLLLTAAGLIILLSLLNFSGIKESARFNTIATLIEVGGLVLIIIFGISFIGSVNYFEVPSQSGSILEYLSPIAIAAALIFFAYIGFEDLANITEETINATRNIPRALIISVIISTILYILVAIVSVSVVPYQQLAEAEGALALVAQTALGGAIGGLLLSVIALFATANTVLILLIVGSRMIYGMASEGSMPAILSKIHSKTQTPYISIILVALFALVMLAVGSLQKDALQTIAFLTNMAIFITFFSVNVSLIVLRYTMPEIRRPFKVPLNIGKFPLIPFFGTIFCLLMLLQLITESITIFGFTIPLLVFGVLIMLISVPLYFLCNWLNRQG